MSYPSITSKVASAPDFPFKAAVQGLAQLEERKMNVTVIDAKITSFKPEWKKLFVEISAETFASLMNNLLTVQNTSQDTIANLRLAELSTPFLDMNPETGTVSIKINTGSLQKKKTADSMTNLFGTAGVDVMLAVETKVFVGCKLNDKTYNGFYFNLVDRV